MNSLEARFSKKQTFVIHRDSDGQYAWVLESFMKRHAELKNCDSIGEVLTSLAYLSFEEPVSTLYVVSSFKAVEETATAMQVLQYLNPTDTVVILCSDKIRPSKASSILFSEYEKVEALEVPSYDWEAFVDEHVSMSGFKCNPETIKEYALRLSKSISELYRTLDVFELVNGRKTFTLSDVQTYVTDYNQGEVFGIINDFMRNRRTEFFRKFDGLKEADYFIFFNFLVKEVANALATSQMLESGVDQSYIANALGVNAFAHRNSTMLYTRVYTKDRLFRMNKELTTAFYDYLFTKHPKKSYIESVILKFWT